MKCKQTKKNIANGGKMRTPKISKKNIANGGKMRASKAKKM